MKIEIEELLIYSKKFPLWKVLFHFSAQFCHITSPYFNAVSCLWEVESASDLDKRNMYMWRDPVCGQ